jgi:hypothetical protein
MQAGGTTGGLAHPRVPRDPLGIRIGIASVNMPNETFQVFEEAERS